MCEDRGRKAKLRNEKRRAFNETPIVDNLTSVRERASLLSGKNGKFDNLNFSPACLFSPALLGFPSSFPLSFFKSAPRAPLFVVADAVVYYGNGTKGGRLDEGGCGCRSAFAFL